jgi:hypothetical protein
MNETIKAGADIHAGDGGYSIGTKEKYDEFVKGRNQSLGQMRIKELAIQAGLIAPYGSDQEGLRDFDYREFAKLIVQDCLAQVDKVDEVCEDDAEKLGISWVGYAIAKHFGVEG